ncbi:hypothetical protein ES703_102744 [subsurface metagenome]
MKMRGNAHRRIRRGAEEGANSAPKAIRTRGSVKGKRSRVIPKPSTASTRESSPLLRKVSLSASSLPLKKELNAGNMPAIKSAGKTIMASISRKAAP